MKRIDFEKGTVTGNILNAAIPMLVAQILNLLYNIVDRIYIARIQDVGTTALGAVGLCFPIIMIITAFSNLFGSGGAPIFSINRGKGDSRTADMIMNTAFTMLCGSAAILMLIGIFFARPLLTLFGASDDALISWLCLSLSDHLSAGNPAIYDSNRYESFYQCTGICHHRYAVRGNWSCSKYYSGSDFYFYFTFGN